MNLLFRRAQPIVTVSTDFKNRIDEKLYFSQEKTVWYNVFIMKRL